MITHHTSLFSIHNLSSILIQHSSVLLSPLLTLFASLISAHFLFHSLPSQSFVLFLGFYLQCTSHSSPLNLIPHSSLLTLHSSLFTRHSSIFIPNSSLLTPHSSLLTPRSSMITPQPSLITPQPPLLSSHSSFLIYSLLTPYISLITHCTPQSSILTPYS